jgi:Peptidase M1 N-terminal domain
MMCYCLPFPLFNRTLYSDASKAEQIATFSSFDETQERAAYHLDNALPADSKAEFKIVYKGKLTGSMMGYYRSAWENQGKTKHYALTQFEVRAAYITLYIPFQFSLFKAHRCSTRVPLLG